MNIAHTLNLYVNDNSCNKQRVYAVAYRGRGGLGGSNLPASEISKALQNRAKLNQIVITVKNWPNLGRQHPKMFGKEAVKV